MQVGKGYKERGACVKRPGDKVKRSDSRRALGDMVEYLAGFQTVLSSDHSRCKEDGDWVRCHRPTVPAFK